MIITETKLLNRDILSVLPTKFIMFEISNVFMYVVIYYIISVN